MPFLGHITTASGCASIPSYSQAKLWISKEAWNNEVCWAVTEQLHDTKLFWLKQSLNFSTSGVRNSSSILLLWLFSLFIPCFHSSLTHGWDPGILLIMIPFSGEEGSKTGITDGGICSRDMYQQYMDWKYGVGFLSWQCWKSSFILCPVKQVSLKADYSILWEKVFSVSLWKKILTDPYSRVGCCILCNWKNAWICYIFLTASKRKLFSPSFD